MKLRRLQRLNDQEDWGDNAYAYEDEAGRVVFRYSVLTWGRVGAASNVQLQQAEIPLTQVEGVIPTSDRLRWLPIEEIANAEADIY